jgi:cell division protein FtsZ
MVFITAGMGGGTGTGAAPLIAAYAREQGALTVSVVLTPFAWEGPRKAEKALNGLANLRDTSDTVIVVSNEKLMSVCERGTKMTDAYQMADGVLIQGVRGIADLILRPGLVNLDFADVESVLKDGGEAFIGTGMGRGEEAVMDALLKALASPLLDRAADGFATNVIVSVMAHPDQVGFSEFSTAMNYLHERFEGHAEIKPGQVLAPEMEDRVVVTVLASGFEAATSSTSLSLYQRTVAPSMDNAPHNAPSGRVYGEVPPDTHTSHLPGGQLPTATPTRLMPQGPTPSGEMANQAEDLHVPAIIRLSQGRLPIE